jgi:MYXO-CTERM domain-containing protein
LSHSSHWDDEQTWIVTDLEILRDDGRIDIVSVPGGTVDGIGMIQWEQRVGGAPTTDLLGFVRSQTTKGQHPLRWEYSGVYIRPDPEGTPDLAGDDELAIITDMLDNWVKETRHCGYLSFVEEARQSGHVGYDGINRVLFHNEVWCKKDDCTKPVNIYAPQATALTTLFFINKPSSASDGIILDADIELNGVNFSFRADGAPEGGKSPASLANTMAHEVGHLVGLDHTCWVAPEVNFNAEASDDVPHSKDNQGNEVPDCSLGRDRLPKEVVEATMFNFQDENETSKISLSSDDIQGFCAIYPVANDPMELRRAVDLDPGCGCRVGATPARSPASGLLVLFLAALPFFATRRRAAVRAV